MSALLLLLALPIQVGQVPLYEGPSFLSPVDTVLVQGTEVKILSERPGWKNVVVPSLGKRGWIPETALKRPPLLRPGRSSAHDEEKAVALASKGLASVLEDREKAHPGAREALERLEQISREALHQLAEFAREGGLR